MPRSSQPTAGVVATGRWFFHGWEIPFRRDPRIPFAALLTLYCVLGATVLGFSRSLALMIAVALLTAAVDFALTWASTGRKVVPLSAYITGCSLAILVNYAHGSWLFAVPIALALGSKHLLTFDRRHVFNPSMFGVAVSLLFSNELITAAPAYQWMGTPAPMAAFVVMAALALFVFRVGRGPLVISFLAFYALQTAARAYILRYHLPPETLFFGTLSAPAFFLFTFYMITDPATSPARPRAQVLLALALTLVDLYLHTKESVYTFFYASLIVGTARFLFLHVRAAWNEGLLPRIQLLATPAFLRRVAAVSILVVGTLGLNGLASQRTSSTIARGLTFSPVPLSESGLGSTMGHTLEEVDPRLAHVAKWLLSVGDSIAAGDFDGDGKVDLFLTHPLAVPEDRAALYRNLGNLRFERVPLPAIDSLLADPAELGLPTGGVFVDYDGDGDEDLVIAWAFGKMRLLRNMLHETGRPDFVDATAESGVDERTVSLAVTFLDYDRDGVLDLFIANVMPSYLADYPVPTPLNIFRLPQPEYRGDRRMFHFMHNGWHNANNGGLNVLYRGLGNGRFEKMDAKRMGITGTHWSLSVATVDLNRDGWTDLYVANDFGPDDVYLNQGGRRFVKVQGSYFGEIGRDTYKGMNASVADFDRNGWLDVYVSNVHHSLQAEGSLLWMLGPGSDSFVPRFSDEAWQRGALNERRFGWGAAAGDLNLDGWPDLLQANGMANDRLDRRYEGQKDYWYFNHKLMQSGPEIHTYADAWGDLRGRTIYPDEPRRLYLNLGDAAPGHFTDVAAQVGVADPDDSRGVLLSDLDDDGDLDVLISNQHGPVSLYRNELLQNRRDLHFVSLWLVGDGFKTNTEAVGTRVTVRYPENGNMVELVQERGLLAGFSAQSDPRLHFGLGAYAGPVDVTVDWYNGDPQRFQLEPDRLHVLHAPSHHAARR